MLRLCQGFIFCISILTHDHPACGNFFLFLRLCLIAAFRAALSYFLVGLVLCIARAVQHMEVVGKQAPIPPSSAWATPLTFSTDPKMPRRVQSMMSTNTQHDTSTAKLKAHIPSSSLTSTAPPPSEPTTNVTDPIHLQGDVFPPSSSSSMQSSLRSSSTLHDLSTPFHSGYPETSHPLVRSESAPLNILEESLEADLRNVSFSPSCVDRDPLSESPPMTFAAATANGLPFSPPSSSPMGLLGNPSQRKPPNPISSATKPRPPRSRSSVELAGIVNAAGTPGVSAVPARRTATGNSSGMQQSNKIPVRGPSASSEKERKSKVPAWHKSVFDMIQDDFPKTPSPMFSTLLGRTDAAQQPGNDIKALASDRRSRLASTASLNLDLERLGTASDPTNELTASLKPSEDPVVTNPSVRRHRRSVSVNWAGDVGAISREIARSSSRSNLLSSSNSALFTSEHHDLPAPQKSVGLGGQHVVSSSFNPSGSTSPSQSLSPTGSGSRSGITPSPPQSSPGLPMRHLAPNMSAVNPSEHLQHPRVPPVVHTQRSRQLGPYALPSPGVDVHPPSIEDLNAAGLVGYEYLYNHPEGPPGGHAPVTGSQIGPAFPGPPYPASQPNLFGDVSTGLSHVQPLANSSQYGNAFQGSGVFPAFSSGTGGIGNGAAPVYTDSFRDGIAAADNLKNMSIQMAAFLTAQQQIYAAQVAHMTALAGTTGFNQQQNSFSGIPGGMGHLSNPPTGHPRSPWDPREPSPPRLNSRGKQHYDQYRGGGHTGGQKKTVCMDTSHKGRGSRGRRVHRGHDELSFFSGHKPGGRVTFGGNLLGGGIQDSVHVRSPLLEEFRATSNSIGRGIGSVGDLGMSGGGYGPGIGQVQNGREWQLSEIKSNVVEFATDQHGSRFIQQKLELASSEDKESILKEALTDAQRLMTDVFGNYVVQKLLDHGGHSAVTLIASDLEGRMLALSLHMYGCRVVQKALEVLEASKRATLVRELDGHVLKCIRDQNGNHVIQKCVELVEPDSVQFIVDSVQGQAVALAGHSYGCRVVQRILEHGAPNQKTPIMAEIMSRIADLIKDQYGNYVIQHVVEHGTIDERSVIMNLVRGEVCQLSQHKFASNVVERCLQFGSPDERRVLIEILLVGEGAPNASPLNHLVRDQFGNYVVQRVLDVAMPPQRERVVSILRAQVPAIKKYSYGKHIIARLEEHQGGGSSGYHNHPNGSHGNGSVHRDDRQIPPSMMSVGATHGMPQGPHNYLYYE